ncbi:DUF4352 domain-containing protein [Rhodococcoides kroppenstedtii]|uniref:DUF4352 domain-containing protein n=1 Tax=Rhodococcoides kroppenstedtii TaxID=293050 RepID=UPI0009EE349C|nr:DUF4352 domain-containing protein [Rhodococcus kroppenstedtii]
MSSPPGWFPDPVDPKLNRFWDGRQWTPQTRNKDSMTVSASPDKTKRVTWIVCGVAAAVVFLFAAIGGTASDEGTRSNNVQGYPYNAPTSSTRSITAPSVRPTPVPVAPAEQQVPPAQPTRDAPSQAGIGEAVRDGKFEFLVTAWDGETAQLTVTNIGDRPQSFAISAQYLYDVQQRRFEPEFEWDSDLAFADLNPGQSVSGAITFVLSGAVPDYLELHDSVFSGGVKVPLR